MTSTLEPLRDLSAVSVTEPESENSSGVEAGGGGAGATGELPSPHPSEKSNTIVLPANVADVGSMVALAMKLIKTEN